MMIPPSIDLPSGGCWVGLWLSRLIGGWARFSIISSAPSAWGLTLTLTSPEAYKNLYHLLELDTEATLDVLKCAFVDDNQHLIQKTVDVLAVLLETGPPDTNWPSEVDRCHILDFISHFVACGEAKVSKELLRVIFEYLISPTKRQKEKQVLSLLAHTDWDDVSLLDMCQKANFYQVCGFIYNSKHQYIAAIDSFMKDVDEPIHVFSYIHNLLRDKRPNSLEAAVISRIPDLVHLSREGTVFLVVEHFYKDFQQILVELRCNLKSLFLFLKTVVEADSLSFNSLRKGEPLVKNQIDDFLQRISDFPKFLRENPLPVTDEITELYLELLCEYEPNNVLHFLESCESYRVDHCLRLCQEHGVIDAAAFLLERVGDVGTALSFTLSDVPHKFTMLHAALQTVDASSNDIIKKKEVSELLYIVYTCVGLCQRNSSRLDPNESEALWFQLLDTFCEPLSNGSGQADIGIGSDKGLRKLLSIFIKEIIEGMIGYVRLPVIMMKLLSDNGSQEFGDFKATILGMLGTYDFERRILDTARCLIEDDTYYTMRLLKKGASHGHGPRTLVCCICNCVLTSSSSSRGIRVYNCGHASHLQCELQTSGCPVCMPKKKGMRPVPIPIHNGLVTMPLPKHKSSQGTPAAENDALDRQISRYEILSNLDKDKRMLQIDNMPHLRLAPPALYHEKVNKGVGQGQTNNSKAGKQIKDAKTNIRFPLKSNIFGKEKTSRR